MGAQPLWWFSKEGRGKAGKQLSRCRTELQA
jgi:hypothetical protein